MKAAERNRRKQLGEERAKLNKQKSNKVLNEHVGETHEGELGVECVEGEGENHLTMPPGLESEFQ